MAHHHHYPANWKKVSQTIRRVAGYRCERCGRSNGLAVHHLGIGYVNGRASDKHDIRRENLQALCFTCHNSLEYIASRTRKRKKRKRLKRERLEKHRALGIGVGLVCLTGKEQAEDVQHAK